MAGNGWCDISDVETSIRITAETKAALQNLATLDTQMGASARAILAASENASRAVTGTGRAFDRTQARAVVLTSSMAGLPPVIGQAVTAFATMAVPLAAISVGIGVVVSGLSHLITTTGELRTQLDKSREALIENSKGYGIVAAEAQRVLNVHTAMLVAERAQITTKIELASKGKIEADVWDKIAASILMGGINSAILTAEYKQLSMESTELNAASAALQQRFKEINDILNKGRDASAGMEDVLSKIAALIKDGTDATKKLADEQIRLNKANDDALARGMAEHVKDQADNTQKLLDVERQRAQLRAEGAEGGGLAGILKSSDATIERERTAYQNRLANANAFDGSRQLIESQFTLFVEQEESRRFAAVKGLQDRQVASMASMEKVKQTIRLTTAQVELRSFVANAAQMLILQHANLRETIAAIIAEQKARLAAIAIVALVEGLYYSITNPAAAASKFATAALATASQAGAGAIALGIIGSALEKEPAAREVQGLAATAGAGGGGESTGRTLVSQGPVTLYYNATLIVNGSILDKGDFFALWNEASLQNLRTANVDVSQRARK